MLSEAIDNGRCQIGVVQAILIMVYWKEPSDQSAWIKIRVAVAMGYQLGYHIPRAADLPTDAKRARSILVSFSRSSWLWS